MEEASQSNGMRYSKKSYPSVSPYFPNNLAGYYVVYYNNTGDGEDDERLQWFLSTDSPSDVCNFCIGLQ